MHFHFAKNKATISLNIFDTIVKRNKIAIKMKKLRVIDSKSKLVLKINA